MIRIHTVGAGGGSLARLDAGGALVVGPQSAGADPGPVCYGRGHGLTVTDANLFLGRLDPDHFLGGRMKIHPESIAGPMEALAGQAGLSPEQMAEGIIRVINSAMEKAIRVISVERGYDPRDFCLVTFGGAGGLHACDLARSLGVSQVLIPPNPGVLSALGMVLSDVVVDNSRTILTPTADTDWPSLEALFQPMVDGGLQTMADEGFTPDRIRIERHLDMRYQGQSFEITVPFAQDFPDRFHHLHEKIYGARHPARPTEVVNLRLRLTGLRPSAPMLRESPSGRDVRRAIIGQRLILVEGARRSAPVIDRQRLTPGHRFTGPALVVEMSSTTYVPPDFSLSVDPWRNLRLTPAAKEDAPPAGLIR